MKGKIKRALASMIAGIMIMQAPVSASNYVTALENDVSVSLGQAVKIGISDLVVCQNKQTGKALESLEDAMTETVGNANSEIKTNSDSVVSNFLKNDIGISEQEMDNIINGTMQDVRGGVINNAKDFGISEEEYLRLINEGKIAADEKTKENLKKNLTQAEQDTLDLIQLILDAAKEAEALSGFDDKEEEIKSGIEDVKKNGEAIKGWAADTISNNRGELDKASNLVDGMKDLIDKSKDITSFDEFVNNMNIALANNGGKPLTKEQHEELGAEFFTEEEEEAYSSEKKPYYAYDANKTASLGDQFEEDEDMQSAIEKTLQGRMKKYEFALEAYNLFNDGGFKDEFEELNSDLVSNLNAIADSEVLRTMDIGNARYIQKHSEEADLDSYKDDTIKLVEDKDGRRAVVAICSKCHQKYSTWQTCGCKDAKIISAPALAESFVKDNYIDLDLNDPDLEEKDLNNSWMAKSTNNNLGNSLTINSKNKDGEIVRVLSKDSQMTGVCIDLPGDGEHKVSIVTDDPNAIVYTNQKGNSYFDYSVYDAHEEGYSYHVFVDGEEYVTEGADSLTSTLNAVREYSDTEPTNPARPGSQNGKKHIEEGINDGSFTPAETNDVALVVCKTCGRCISEESLDLSNVESGIGISNRGDVYCASCMRKKTGLDDTREASTQLLSGLKETDPDPSAITNKTEVTEYTQKMFNIRTIDKEDIQSDKIAKEIIDDSMHVPMDAFKVELNNLSKTIRANTVEINSKGEVSWEGQPDSNGVYAVMTGAEYIERFLYDDGSGDYEYEGRTKLYVDKDSGAYEIDEAGNGVYAPFGGSMGTFLVLPSDENYKSGSYNDGVMRVNIDNPEVLWNVDENTGEWINTHATISGVLFAYTGDAATLIDTGVLNGYSQVSMVDNDKASYAIITPENEDDMVACVITLLSGEKAAVYVTKEVYEELKEVYPENVSSDYARFRSHCRVNPDPGNPYEGLENVLDGMEEAIDKQRDILDILEDLLKNLGNDLYDLKDYSDLETVMDEVNEWMDKAKEWLEENYDVNGIKIDEHLDAKRQELKDITGWDEITKSIFGEWAEVEGGWSTAMEDLLNRYLSETGGGESGKYSKTYQDLLNKLKEQGFSYDENNPLGSRANLYKALNGISETIYSTIEDSADTYTIRVETSLDAEHNTEDIEARGSTTVTITDESGNKVFYSPVMSDYVLWVPISTGIFTVKRDVEIYHLHQNITYGTLTVTTSLYKNGIREQLIESYNSDYSKIDVDGIDAGSARIVSAPNIRIHVSAGKTDLPDYAIYQTQRIE